MTIAHAKIAGDAYARGRQLGERAVAAMRDVVSAGAEFQSLLPWRGSIHVAQLEAAARRHFPWIVREIEGIADGAQQPFETIFLWNCRGDLRLPEGASLLDRDRAAEGCTTLLLPGADGWTIAHNEDGDSAYADHAYLAEVTPDDAPAFVCFCYPGQVPGHTMAATSAGLVQTINNIRAEDLQAGLPRHVVTRAVLAAASLEEALVLLRRPDRASGFHHGLADWRSGRLLSVEAPASGCVVREVTTPAAHANHLLDARLASLDRPVSSSSRTRQKRADTLLAAGVREPLDILFDRTDAKLPIHRRGDGRRDNGYTLATGCFRRSDSGVAWRIYDESRTAPVFDGVLAVTG